MKAIFFLLSFIAVYSQQYSLIASSNLETTIMTSGFSTSLAGFHNVYNPSMLGQGAFWIWNNQVMASPQGRTLTFQTLFYLSCTTPLQLNITADDHFTAYIDEKIVVKGNNWRLINSITINLGCGSHNLTITVTQGNSQYGPGLIFIMTQNKSGCYDCGLNGEWNYKTCRCGCLTVCGCALPQIWMDYPGCTCRCPVEKIKKVGVEQTIQDDSLMLNYRGQLVNVDNGNCSSGQYYSHVSCNCRCLPKFCGERFVWDDDVEVCGCVFNV